MHGRYLRDFIFACLFGCGVVAAVNLVVDPYGVLFGAASDRPVARILAPQYPLIAKPTLYSEAAPDTVLFGNSRIAYAFDPASPDWPSAAGVGFNYGIQSARVTTFEPYFLAALRSSHLPKRILIGVDFFYDGMTSAETAEPPPSEISALAEGKGAGWVALARLNDIAMTALSVTTLRDSLRTLWKQRRGRGSGYNAQGYYNSLGKSCTDRGCGGKPVRSMFLTKLKAYRRAFLGDIAMQHLEAVNSSTERLRILVDAAEDRGIEVIVFFYPYHATMIDLIERSGRWPQYVSWKRGVVEATESSGGTIWDFSKINDLSAEAPPAKTASSQMMERYYEPSHFKPAIGNKIVNCVVTGQECFGVQITSKTFEAVLAEQRAVLDGWRESQPEISEITSAANGAASP